MKRKVAKLRLSPNEEAQLMRQEYERRRKLRIQQVREQQRYIALQIRQDVEQRRQREMEQLEEELRKDWERQQREKLHTLQRLYQESLQLIGQGHRSAKENQPDLEAIARREEENHSKAEERYREALKELKSQRLKDQERESRSINARKKALQAEKERSAKVASLPPPANPIQNIDSKKPHIVKKSDVSAFAATHYHMPETTVDREVDTEQRNAHEGAELEGRRLQDLQREEETKREEQLEKAHLRGKQALRREQLTQDRERLLVELEHMQQTDLLRRRQQVSQMPPQIFQPLYKRQEMREDFQREMEFAFEDMYTGERRIKGDLVVQLVPEPLPAPSTGSQDQELDVTLDEIATLDEENAQRRGAEQEAGSTEQETSSHAEPSRPAPRRTLRKLLDRIRNQRNQWTIHSGHVPTAASQTIVTDQIPERDTMTIDTGSLTSEERDRTAPVELPQTSHSPPTLETTEQSAAADTLLPDVLADKIQEFEEVRKKKEEELERQKQQQMVFLQELEGQKAKLEQMLLEAQREREDLKAAVAQEVPVKQPEVPVHDQEVTHRLEPAPPAGEDDHTGRLREYQQRLLEQNRIHQRSVEVARQRLEEYQRALRIRYNMTATSTLHTVVPPGHIYPPLRNTQYVHFPTPLQPTTTPRAPAHFPTNLQNLAEVPTRESDILAARPHLPESRLSVESRLLSNEGEFISNRSRVQDATVRLTSSIMERVTEHLPERLRPSSVTTEPYKLLTSHHSTTSTPLTPASDPIRDISPNDTDVAPLGQIRVKPGTLPCGSLLTSSLREDSMEHRRRELQEIQRRVLQQREAMELQQRQQERERELELQRRQQERERQKEAMELQRTQQDRESQREAMELQRTQQDKERQREAMELQQRQQDRERQREAMELQRTQQEKERRRQEEQQREVMELQQRQQDRERQRQEEQQREVMELQRRQQDRERQRQEEQQREVMELQRRQQEKERRRQEEEMVQMRRQKEALEALIDADAQPTPEVTSEVLASEEIGQTRLKLLASLLRAIEESNGGTLSQLETHQEEDKSTPPPPPSTSETDPIVQSSVPAGSAPTSVLPSELPPPPRAAKPPVTRVRLGIMEMNEQHELSAIQEVESPLNTSQVTGPEDGMKALTEIVELDPQEESESSVASDETLQTPSVSSSELLTDGRPTASMTNSRRSSWRERLLTGAGTSPESSKSDSSRRIISPISSDSGRGADYSGLGIASYRSFTESEHRPPDSDCLSSTTISTGSYVTTDPEQNFNADESVHHIHHTEQEEGGEAHFLDVSSPSPSPSALSSAAGRPSLAVDSLFNESSIQRIIDRYTRELNISLSTAGKTTDSEGSSLEEPSSSVSQQSLAQASEIREEDETSTSHQSLPSDTSAAQRSSPDNTVDPVLDPSLVEEQDSFRPLIGQLADQSSCLAADPRESTMEQLVGQPSAHSSMIGQLPGPLASVSTHQGGWDSTLSRMIGQLSMASSSHWLSGGQDFYAGQLLSQMDVEQSTTWVDEGQEESNMRQLVGELDETAGQQSASSGERTSVDLGVSTEAGVPSYSALRPETSVPAVTPQPEYQTQQSHTGPMEVGPERTEDSVSFHPLLAEVTHNETIDPSMIFHLPEHDTPSSPEGHSQSRERSVSTHSEDFETCTNPSVESEPSPERLRAEEPSRSTSTALQESFSQLVTSQCLPHESVLTVSPTTQHPELTAQSLSDLTVCDSTPTLSMPPPEEGEADRKSISERDEDSGQFNKLPARELESVQSSNLKNAAPFSDRIKEAASKKGILEDSEITLVSVTDTTVDQDTTVSEEEEMWEDKHPQGFTEEGQRGQETDIIVQVWECHLSKSVISNVYTCC
ncbi:centrosomal protein of 295 kDa [Scomber scombrus]|uniref:centrosomal protein of 295 kDa n=1 Tax=Scomber scombrus TaxID=13677 RepID=UPI002DDC41A5|nr:centrosomal protein of 295 kDa [Scomber scombrus]